MLFLLTTILFVSSRTSAQEPYAVLSDGNTVLTFYYDGQKTERGGMSIGPFSRYNDASWFAQNESITSVVFDDSFASCTSITSTANWFSYCSNLTTITGIGNLKTDNVTDMNGMFRACSKLTSLDLSGFNTENVTDMGIMFSGCSCLTSLNVSGFKTDKVTNMGSMFRGCYGLTSLDVSRFNTENVTNMCAMFESCANLSSLNLSNFNTSKVDEMADLFRYCSNIEEIDVSSFDTHNVTSMGGIFWFCKKLKELNLSNFDTRNLKKAGAMFQECSVLEQVVFGENFTTESFSDMENDYIGFAKTPALKSIKIMRDVPVMASKAFIGVGSKSDPVVLYVPEEYISNYESQFKNGKYCEGYFTLKSYTENGEDEGIPDTPDVDPSTPAFNNKKIQAITRETSSGTERGEISYDSEGRVVKFSITDTDPAHSPSSAVYNYSYSDNTINISREGTNENRSYTIANGRVESSSATGDAGYNESTTYKYNSDKTISEVLIKSSESGTGTYVSQVDFSWAGSNLTSIVTYWGKEGSTLKEDQKMTMTYNDLTSEPLLHAWFGLINTTNEVNLPDGMLAKKFNLLAIYPYLGTLPQNLYSEFNYDESGDVSNYTYSYETNSNGDIVKVTIVRGKRTTVFTFEWGDSSELVDPVDNSFTIGDLKYTNTDGSNVSVAAANTSISGSLQIPSMVRNEGSMYNVTSIAESGFEGCTGISSVTIPASITTIGDKGFYGCSGLTELTVNIKEPISISESVFSGVDKKKCVLNVPENCGDKYREAAGWKEFWLVAAAGETIVDGITYEVESDGTATIISANHSADGHYEIPSAVIIGGEEYPVTGIASNAFYGCTDMTAVTIPASIKAIGDYAFAGCENLMEVYCESTTPIDLSKAFSRGINKTIRRAVTQFSGVNFDLCKLYVPYGYESLYRDAEGWKDFKNIIGVHGFTDPAITVTAKNYTRKYGEDNPAFDFDTVGAALDGTPELSCVADKTSDVGSYEIIIKKGSVQNYNDTYVAGTLTVTKAELKVIAPNATREQYEDNPEFVITYEGWLNGDDENVLTEKPTATTSATKDSEQGEYAIVVSGGQAKNYELVYVNGILKVTESTGIDGILSDGHTYDVYNLQGHKVRNQVTSLDDLPTGVYIVNGRKVVK